MEIEVFRKEKERKKDVQLKEINKLDEKGYKMNE
jgi:hypothetical protein